MRNEGILFPGIRIRSHYHLLGKFPASNNWWMKLKKNEDLELVEA